MGVVYEEQGDLACNGGDVIGCEEDDDEALTRLSDAATQALVTYDIVHSPSYQVPVLYLTCMQFHPKGQRPGALPPLDEVYELLVAPSQSPQMQSVGVMGALSMTDHPISGMPAYFVHPCRTSEAMSAVTAGKDVTPEQYLLMWLGLVGPSVGLEVPVELAESITNSD